MKTYPQHFIMKECKMCSKERERFGRGYYIVPRKFVTSAGDPNIIICTNPKCCGFTTQLNKQEVKK